VGAGPPHFGSPLQWNRHFQKTGGETTEILRTTEVTEATMEEYQSLLPPHFLSVFSGTQWNQWNQWFPNLDPILKSLEFRMFKVRSPCLWAKFAFLRWKFGIMIDRSV